MSHVVAYILQFQEIIVYKIPPGGGGGSIASLRSNYTYSSFDIVTPEHLSLSTCYCVRFMQNIYIFGQEMYGSAPVYDVDVETFGGKLRQN